MPEAAEAFRVERADQTMAAQLADVHRAGFQRAWTTHDFVRFLAGGAVAWIALAGPLPVGMILLRAVVDEAEVLTIATHPDWRGRGIGRRLLDGAAADLGHRAVGTLFLEVASDNAPAIRLYQAAGFEECGRRASYYSRGDHEVDALLMRRKLNSDAQTAYGRPT